MIYIKQLKQQRSLCCVTRCCDFRTLLASISITDYGHSCSSNFKCSDHFYFMLDYGHP